MNDLDDRLLKRSLEASDIGFILDSWGKGAWSCFAQSDKMDKEQWFKDFYETIRQMVLSDADIIVACLEKDPDFILGYAVIKGEELLWIYTKEMFRNQGVAGFILDGQTLTSVGPNLTRLGKELLPKLKLN